MRALSLREPHAYLRGVLVGDGWLGTALGLRVADYAFALAFAGALGAAFRAGAPPRRDERGYWVVMRSARSGRFDRLPRATVATRDQRCAWLRGLFDSEGNASLCRRKKYEHSFSRRVSFYSTNKATLRRAARYLATIGLSSRWSPVKPSAGHLGTLPVFELAVRSSRENYATFARLVGSSIGRKRRVLEALPKSYSPDISESCRRAQLKGAAAKHRKTMTVTLASVVVGVRELVTLGVKPTQRACRAIKGYNSIQKHVPQAKLVRLAKRAA